MPFFAEPPLHDFPDRANRLLLQHPANLRELVQQVAPHVVDGFAFERMVLLDRAFPLPDWRRRETDLLFHIPFQTLQAEEPTLVCVLLEHQSLPDPSMPLRTLQYAVSYWERQWRAWEEKHPEGEPLRLSPVLPIIFHTGAQPWKSYRALADLLTVPEPFRRYIPSWQPLFFDLAEQRPEVLLRTPGAWLPTMALVRAEREPAEVYAAYTANVVRHLEPLSERDQVRWRDLLWFILSWGLRRRPLQEHQQLFATVMSSHNSVILQKEVAAMSQTVVQTWEEAVFARALLRASRDNLRVVFEERFGTLPEGLVQRIEATEDLERLKAALRQGVRITALDQLQL